MPVRPKERLKANIFAEGTPMKMYPVQVTMAANFTIPVLLIKPDSTI